MIIDDFISSRHELKNAECIEFSDDGFSGANLNRPGIQRLLDEIKNEKLNHRRLKS
jgi:DNA invertase Pin-like site-specific DNA recombinase